MAHQKSKLGKSRASRLNVGNIRNHIPPFRLVHTEPHAQFRYDHMELYAAELLSCKMVGKNNHLSVSPFSHSNPFLDLNLCQDAFG